MNDLLQRVYPRVYEVVHRRLQRSRRETLRRYLATYSTGDMVQEIFIKVVAGLERFAGDDEETLVNYLGVLVRNTLADRLRYFAADRRDSRNTVDDVAAVVSGDASPSTRVSASEQVDLYRDVLKGFTERERRLLRMRIEAGTPFAVLARELSFPTEDAARKAYNAVRARLLTRLRRRGVGA